MERAREIEALAETTLSSLAQNSDLVSNEYETFLKRIQQRVDEVSKVLTLLSRRLIIQLSEQCMQAAKYDEQRAMDQCAASAQTEQRLSMIITHCRELQLEFRELKDLAQRV